MRRFARPSGVAALIGLVWMVWVTIEFVSEGPDGVVDRVLALSAVAAFTAYVIWVVIRGDVDKRTAHDGLRVAAFPALVDVGLALAGRDEWVAVMTVYVVVYVASGQRGWRIAVPVLAGAAATFGLTALAGTDLEETVYDTLIALSIAGMIAATSVLERTNAELQEARAELARIAVADERRRFARDLHDLLGHSLSMIAIKARLAQRVQHSDPARATQELVDIENAARSSLAEVRETVSGYRRATIATELAGVRAALEAAGVDLDTRVTRMELDAEDEAVLAWALREATTNVVRHAEASSVIVRIEPAGHGARLEVEDDGRGAGTNGAPGNGLQGVAERVAARDGWVQTGASPGGGFRLTVELPGTIPA
ncbi:MAG TPA: sensor histidine kinase [Solirubrobacteraceae bacterium]